MKRAEERGHVHLLRIVLILALVCAACTAPRTRALVQAAGVGDSVKVKLLLDEGADIESKAPHGVTALMEAAAFGQNDTVKLLMDRGANIEATINDGRTPLIVAATEGHTHTVKLLLEKGANINASADGGTALSAAAYIGHSDVAALLVDRGANIEGTDRWGKTALVQAVTRNNVGTARLLLNRGADIDTRDNDGGTPLMQAAARNYIGMVELLLNRGANVEARERTGYTALMIAKRQGHSEIVNRLGGTIGARARVPDKRTADEPASLEAEAAGGKASGSLAALGLGLVTLTAETRRELGHPPGLEGVLVSSVMRQSPADNAGLLVDDVILQVEREAIHTPRQASRAILAADPPVLVLVKRMESTVFLTLTPPR